MHDFHAKIYCRIKRSNKKNRLQSNPHIASASLAGANMEIIRNAIKTVLFLTFAFNASIWLFVIGYKLYMPKAQFQIPLKFTHEQQQISSTADLQSYSHYLSKWSTKYSVWIHLIVPDNQTNNSLGNFMVSLTVVQINESIPLIMCYKSFIVRTAKCLLKLPLFLVCGWQEEQHLKGCLVKDVKIQSRLLDITIFSDRLQIYHGYLEFGQN